MKEKKTLQQKLKERKYKIPDRFIAALYHLLSKIFILRKYKPHITIEDDINDCKGPCFLIWNHLSRLDHSYLIEAAYPRRISIVAGYSEFFRSHLHTVFYLNQILPKKNYTQDIAGMKAMQSILNQGGCVAFSPEGMSSIYGTNQPVVPGSGHYLKHYGYPVYFMEMRGQYLTNTKVCLDERISRTEATMKLLFSPEDLKKMTDQEVEDKLNEVFRHDDYEWGRERHLKWTNMKNSCERLSDICFRCPKCGADLKMEASGDTIRCSACGNGARVNAYYEFEPLSSDAVLPESPAKWYRWERKEIIQEIRSDDHYSVTVPVTVGYQPPYKYVKDKTKTTTPCGKGEITFDHQGIHFTGEKLGEPFTFDLSYETVFSLVIERATDLFGLYVKGEWYEFIPEEPIVGKLILITEEMHRLHYNIWKNFPWEADLYEADQKKEA
ncbi:MAG: 1-acyl-sn-glycerol-3-phosphate acyltransferase [Lachnospiraceae bacterium]|nr:1-acyl-sn-glycerol-3-phosphate acyltransferase [Lachnospiraceae bacterium]